MMKIKQKTSILWKATKDELEVLVRKSNTYTEILSYFNLQNKGNNFRTLKNVLNDYDIDYSHISENRWKNFINKQGRTKQKPLSEVLIKGSSYKNANLKKRLLKEGLLINECYICNLSKEWNGKPLVLVLDHIDGDNTNNEIENLRLLCPNCNSQTDTFAGKNIRREKIPQKLCVLCNKEIKYNNKSGYCKECYFIFKKQSAKKEEKIYKFKGFQVKDQEVINTYYEIKNIKGTAKFLQISMDKVKSVLNKYNIELFKDNKPVKQYDLDGNLIKIYSSILSAAKSLGNKNYDTHIGQVCSGKRKTAYGFKWEYAN